MAKKTQRPKKEPKPSPRCKAILLCERTIVDENSGSISLIDLINVPAFPEFPAHTKSMRVFLQLIDGVGEYQMTVEVHDLADDRIIARGIGPTVFFADRLVPLQLFFSIPDLPLLHPGRYDVIVLGNGAEIERQPFRAELQVGDDE